MFLESSQLSSGLGLDSETTSSSSSAVVQGLSSLTGHSRRIRKLLFVCDNCVAGSIWNASGLGSNHLATALITSRCVSTRSTNTKRLQSPRDWWNAGGVGGPDAGGDDHPRADLPGRRGVLLPRKDTAFASCSLSCLVKTPPLPARLLPLPSPAPTAFACSHCLRLLPLPSRLRHRPRLAVLRPRSGGATTESSPTRCVDPTHTHTHTNPHTQNPHAHKHTRTHTQTKETDVPARVFCMSWNSMSGYTSSCQGVICMSWCNLTSSSWWGHTEAPAEEGLGRGRAGRGRGRRARPPPVVGALRRRDVRRRVRHRLWLVLPLPLRLRHRLWLALPPPSRLRHRLCRVCCHRLRG